MSQIKLSVDYYNNIEKEKFKRFPNVTTINGIINSVISVSKGEFLTYMMFTDQMDVNSYRTYLDLERHIPHRLGDIDKFLSFNNESVQSLLLSTQMHQIGFTEKIGVALGLCVINNIHGLTAADWKKIDEVVGNGGHPTFDFEYPLASTGSAYIQVENKGCVNLQNSLKTNSVRNKYSEIKEKKSYIRKYNLRKRIRKYLNSYYGTIGVIDTKTNSTAKVWLVDPPSSDVEMDPTKYKLLARLHYYFDEFKYIGVKESIIKALYDRINEIARTDDYTQFNNKKLDGNFPRLDGKYNYMEDSNFASIESNEAFGKYFSVEYKSGVYFYILGFPKSIMRIIVKQDFEAILKYKYEPVFNDGNVNIVLRSDSENYKRFSETKNLNFVFNERSKYNEAVYYGKISHSSDGRIFGLLNNNKKDHYEDL